MKLKVIRLLLLTTALMLLVGCGGISESDAEATVEAKVKAVLTAVPTATSTPTPVPTPTKIPIPQAPAPTSTPMPTYTAEEVIGIVHRHYERYVKDGHLDCEQIEYVDGRDIHGEWEVTTRRGKFWDVHRTDNETSSLHKWDFDETTGVVANNGWVGSCFLPPTPTATPTPTQAIPTPTATPTPAPTATPPPTATPGPAKIPPKSLRQLWLVIKNPIVYLDYTSRSTALEEMGERSLGLLEEPARGAMESMWRDAMTEAKRHPSWIDIYIPSIKTRSA